MFRSVDSWSFVRLGGPRRNLKKRIPILPLCSLFLSGFSALLLEVVWMRMAILILGTTTRATTAVFASFMAGMALGAFAIAKLLPRIKRPFAAYAGMETIASVLVIVIFLFWRKWGNELVLSTWSVSFFLLIPTFFMGTTVPIIVRGLSCFSVGEGPASAWSYGINTLGGALGALAAAFWVLPALGVKATQLVASFLFLVAGLGGWVYFRVQATSQRISEESHSRWSSPYLKTLLWAAFWGGASALSLEIIWTRLLALILGPSVYALGIVLFVYLSAIGIGALLCPFVMRRLSSIRAIYLCWLLLGFSVGWSIAMVGILPYLFVSLAQLFRPSIESLRYLELLISGLAIFPTALLQGVLLPLLIQAFPKQMENGRSVAWVLGTNTIGAIVGITVTGLFIIPKFGLLPGIIFVLGADLVFGVALLLAWEHEISKRRKYSYAGICALFFAVFLFNAKGFWDRSVLASGVYKYAIGDVLSTGRGKIEVGEILFYREGESSTVAVIRTADDRVLSIDGKADASALGDRSTQVLLGALPASLSDKTERILVIGFASGVTAGVSALFPESQVTAVEIEPAVYEASEYFLDVNHGPLRPPKHQLLVNDARHFLLAGSESFDVITSEPSNPWMSGVAPLFTEEFFVLTKSRLREGGVMCQWLPIYGMSKEIVASVLKTFSSVFPHVLVFESVEHYDLLLIGSRQEIPLNGERIEARWGNKELREELGRIGIRSGLDLVAKFLMGNQGISRFAASAKKNTDDNGYVEFQAPKSLHLKTASMNDKALSQATEGILPYLQKGSVNHELRQALKYRFRLRKEFQLAEMIDP